MIRPLLIAAIWGGGALADESAVAQCLSCHMEDGRLDVVGVRELQDLPENWPLLFEDAFDRDGDGIAGRVGFVSGGGMPLIGKWGRLLAAARFEDFAQIAGAAHDIAVDEDMEAIRAAFEALSPAPVSPFQSEEDLARFEARGCAACHVTETYRIGERELMPLSDFLLHDLGEGEVRTTPLWGCDSSCLSYSHARTEAQGD
ncbi:MAG: hypothetical protein AAGK98_05155 [Pseudomonadota bacterium]